VTTIAALLQRFPVNKVLGINILFWGIVTACTAVAQNSYQVLALRTLLGCFESSVMPSLILLTSAWYKRSDGAARFGIWSCGIGTGQILGGLVAFAAQRSKLEFAGWRIMFLVVGVLNVVVSVLVYRVPSSPSDAEFLTEDEKSLVLTILKADHAGIGAKVFRRKSLCETLLDLQTLFLCLITLLAVMSAGVVVYYSATLIRLFGFNPQMAALLNMPSGVVGIVATITSTFCVARGAARTTAIMVVSGVATIGAALVAFLAPKHHKIGHLMGVYLVSAVSRLSWVL